METKYDFIVGVPCSKLNKQVDYSKSIITTKEDEAVSMAVGAYLVGNTPKVFLQNSGLGNVVDVITSLLKPYNISIRLLISVRHKPAHHAPMGEITRPLLKLLEYDNCELVEEV